MSETGNEGFEPPEPEPRENVTPQAEQSAAPDPINSQITAAVNDANAVFANGSQPGASFDQVAAQAAGLAMLNAANAQQNAYITANATVASLVARILGVSRPLTPPITPAPPKADHV